MVKLKFLSLLTSANLLLSSLPGLAMEESLLEENNFTYGRYVQKHIPSVLQTTLRYTENPEVMTFLFLLHITKKTHTVNTEDSKLIEAIQNSHEDLFLNNLKTRFFG